MTNLKKNTKIPILNTLITYETRKWKTLSFDLTRLCKESLEQTYHKVGLKYKAEVSVVFTDDAHSQVLNRTYRHQDKPTNVLSFGLSSTPVEIDAPLLLGDLVLAFETIEKEAKEQGKSFQAHLSHLLVHGMLHLLGYNHETEKDASHMEQLEIKILSGMEIKNPYTL